jgi:hypothetical protein
MALYQPYAGCLVPRFGEGADSSLEKWRKCVGLMIGTLMRSLIASSKSGGKPPCTRA